jgi:hypothetical protein
MMGLSRPLRLGFHASLKVPQPQLGCGKWDVRSEFFSLFQLLTSHLPAGLGSSLFARRYLGNRVFFLFLWVLRCFSSPGCPHTPIYSVHDDWILLQPGYPIRTSPDLRLLAAPRSFSQLTTSFFDSWRQGIHRTLLLT